jgi:hypothetical protein
VHEESGEKEIKFNLERVGQYLANKDLIIESQDDSDSIWNNLVKSEEYQAICKHIYPYRKNTSLIQEKNAMHASINELFGRLETSIGSGFKLQSSTLLNNSFEIDTNFKFLCSHIIDDDGPEILNLFTVLLSEKNLLFVVHYPTSEVKIAKLEFLNRDECMVNSVGQLTYIDVKFYNTKMLSIFMKNDISTSKNQSCFLQLSVSRLIDEMTERESDEIATFNTYNFIDESVFKIIEGFNGKAMAVSGSRKVAAFLAGNQKIVKLFELEVDELDEGDEDNSNNASFEVEMK